MFCTLESLPEWGCKHLPIQKKKKSETHKHKAHCYQWLFKKKKSILTLNRIQKQKKIINSFRILPLLNVMYIAVWFFVEGVTLSFDEILSWHVIFCNLGRYNFLPSRQVMTNRSCSKEQSVIGRDILEQKTFRTKRNPETSGEVLIGNHW